MIRALVVAGIVVSVWALGESALASTGSYETQEAAVEATLAELLPGWNIAGECDISVTPAPSDVCYRFAPGRSTDEYSIYAAHAFLVTDADWWVGITRVEGGWKPYGGGRCDLFYCRMATPDDEVLFAHPNGDINCDGDANSLDALLILQVVAELIASQELTCWASGDVFPGDDVDSIDALAILQSEAGMIGALPVIQFQLIP